MSTLTDVFNPATTTATLRASGRLAATTARGIIMADSFKIVTYLKS
jgi:hypothetical protein